MDGSAVRRGLCHVVVGVLVIVGGSRSAAAGNGPAGRQWHDAEELQGSGQLSAPEPILEVHLKYDADAAPVLSVKHLAVKQGHVPQYEALSDGYVLSLHSAQGDALYSLTFLIPNRIFDPPPQSGQTGDGQPVVLRAVDFALTVPWFPEAVELRITDPQGLLVIQQSLQGVPVQYNQPHFRSLPDASGSPRSERPRTLRSRLARLLDALCETAEAATDGTLDVTFVGDNYTAADVALFSQDVDRAITHMLTYEPYTSRTSQILFHSVDNTTVDLGCVHDATMDRLIVCNNATVVSVVNDAGAPYDKIIVLVNDPNYGGSGGAITVSYNGGYEPQVTVHEFGHTLGALLDEYNLYSTNGTTDSLTYANCYAGTPPDTTWTGVVASADYAVGCKYPNWYRSSPCSIMLTLSCPYYNLVSQQLLNQKIDVFAGSIAPGVSLSANPTLVGSAGASTLTWTGTNVTSCTASGGWSGSKPTSGSETMTPASTATYTLTCSGASSVAQTVTVTVDGQPPTVSITSPTSGATVSGLVTVSASASDDQSVSRVDFFKDGSLMASDNTSPYNATWNTTAEPAGTHTLTAQAFDGAGNQASASPVAVTILAQVADTTPPLVTILSPTNGASVSGKVNVSVSASDNVAVTSLQLYIDGALKASSTTGSLTTTWNISGHSVKSGAHTLTAKAGDAAGNSATISVTVYK